MGARGDRRPRLTRELVRGGVLPTPDPLHPASVPYAGDKRIPNRKGPLMAHSETLELARIMAALDRPRNMFGPVAARIRARLYGLLMDDSREAWEDARTIVIAPGVTLWQAVVALGCGIDDRPSTARILEALETTDPDPVLPGFGA